jgi:hypothetical protein
MGIGVSAQTSIQAINSLVKSTNSISRNFEQLASCEGDAYNKTKLFAGLRQTYPKGLKEDPEPVACDTSFRNSTINIGQTISAKCAIDSSSAGTFSSQLVNDIKNDVSTLTSQDRETQAEDFWSRLGFNLTTQTNMTTQDLTTLIENSVNENFNIRCVSAQNLGNSAELYLCGNYDNVKINAGQDLVVDNQVRCVSEIISEAMSKNAAVQTAVAKTEQSFKTTGIIVYIIIAVIAIAFIGLLIWIVRANAAKKGINLTEKGASQVGEAGTVADPMTKTEAAVAISGNLTEAGKSFAKTP